MTNSGNSPTARVHLERALDIDPEYALAHGNLGIVLGHIGDLTGAVTHLEKSLQIDPLQPSMQNSLGEVLLKMGKTADARMHFEQALRLEPDFGKAQRNLAGIGDKIDCSDQRNRYSAFTLPAVVKVLCAALFPCP